ncbi:MAG: hypothetical protein CSB44_04970 [Gammaproteobacteria bacterium]|nr:MAG: hypothetical protein CSB44_04970 [Gammaproteobacteria bacterium]
MLNILNFFGGAGRGELLDFLVRGMASQGHLVQVHGPQGTGKTLFSLVLANRLADDYSVVRHDVACLSERSLLRQLMLEFGIPINSRVHQVNAACRLLRRRLIDSMDSHKPPVLLVDSAGDPPEDVVQLLYRLAMMNDDGRPLLRIVLFRRHAPEPDGMQPRWMQHGVHCLHPLSAAETAEYIQHRTLLFDYHQRDAFDKNMCEFVAEKTGGNIAAINQLARRAWFIARRAGKDAPSMSELLMAAVPCNLADNKVEPRFVSRHRGWLVLSLTMAVVATFALLLWYMA